MHYLLSFADLPDNERLQEHASAESPGGFYEVRVLTSGSTVDAPKFKTINRLLGSDPGGILLIGWTWDFLKAARALAGLDRPERDTHEAEFRSLYATQYLLRVAFPEDRLGFAFTFRENPVDAGVKQILRYQLEFGELPPLNETVAPRQL